MVMVAEARGQMDDDDDDGGSGGLNLRKAHFSNWWEPPLFLTQRRIVESP